MLGCVVTAANVGDRAATKDLLRRFWLTLPRLTRIWADGNYDGPLVPWVKNCWGFDLEIVVKPADQKGFSVLPRRWVVERTFAWLGKQRRLSKDYEELPQSSEGFIQIAMSALHECPNGQAAGTGLTFLYSLLDSLTQMNQFRLLTQVFQHDRERPSGLMWIVAVLVNWCLTQRTLKTYSVIYARGGRHTETPTLLLHKNSTVSELIFGSIHPHDAANLLIQAAKFSAYGSKPAYSCW